MKNMVSKILSFFFQGLLYVIPIALTFYIVGVCFLFINDLTNEWTEFVFGFRIPGIGVILTFTVITIIGVLGSNYLSKKIISIINQFISKIPIINSVYSSIRDVLSAFVGKGKKFTNPVSFRISDESEIEMLGFITQKDLSRIGLSKDKVSVYSPLSYGMMGRVIIVPTKYITPLKCSSSEAMKYILSGGLTEISEKQSGTTKKEAQEEESPEQ